MWIHVIQHWLAVHTGTVNESGPFYGFWSGFGSDIGEITIVGAVIAGWHHVNCHTKGCWRFARHPVDGTPYKVCRKHHPEIPHGGATLEQIHRAHAEAKAKKV